MTLLLTLSKQRCQSSEQQQSVEDEGVGRVWMRGDVSHGHRHVDLHNKAALYFSIEDAFLDL